MKKHWTQTPKGRAIMAANAAKRHARKDHSDAEEKEASVEVTAYAVGRVEGLIQHIAQGANISERALTLRVGELLLRSGRGKARRA